MKSNALQLGAQIKKDFERFKKKQEQGIYKAVKQATEGLKAELRGQLSGGNLPRIAKSWQSKVYPENGYSLDAAGVVFSKAPHVIASLDRASVIRSRDGFWLAIPTKNAPRRGIDGKRINPSNFPEVSRGKLRFVYRPNGASLLVVDNVGFSKKTGRATRQHKRGYYKKSGDIREGAGTAVMFFLVPQVSLKKRIDIDGAFKKWGARLPSMIERNL